MTLRTRPVTGEDDVRAGFDAEAETVHEQHGPAARLLAYRVGILRDLARPGPGDRALEIGCGEGQHLRALAPEIAAGHGVDFAPRVVERARRSSAHLPHLTWAVDRGQELSTVEDGSVTLAFCVGALEHMIEQERVLAAVHRVLAPGGRFVLMTPNGGHPWYRRIAPALGVDTRHWSTDRFLDRPLLRRMLDEAGLVLEADRPWTFVPRGDLPPGFGPLLDAIELAGRALRRPAWRGGIAIRARKPT